MIKVKSIIIWIDAPHNMTESILIDLFVLWRFKITFFQTVMMLFEQGFMHFYAILQVSLAFGELFQLLIHLSFVSFIYDTILVEVKEFEGLVDNDLNVCHKVIRMHIRWVIVYVDSCCASHAECGCKNLFEHFIFNSSRFALLLKSLSSELQMLPEQKKTFVI